MLSVRLNRKAVALVNHYLTTVPGPYLLPWMSRYSHRPAMTDAQNSVRIYKAISARTAFINRGLKLISQRLGLPFGLSTHIARHSFATLADNRVPDKRKLSAALGHSRLSTTETYLADLQQSKVNDAMDAVWKVEREPKKPSTSTGSDALEKL